MADNNDNPIQPQLDVQKHLKGMDYPAQKQDLIDHAVQQGAPEEVLSMLKELPEQEYGGPTDVTKAISRS